jgi:AcrR family transcriptional regulator
MPKKIENLRMQILQDAANLLKRDGYEALTIRRVAADCHIAVGTVYNYFPSKDMLAASIMLEEWIHILTEMKQKCAKASSLEKGMHIVYEGILAFAKQYRSSWSTYVFTGRQTSAYKQRHAKLVQQIGECLQPLIKGKNISSHYETFLAENILACVSGSQITIDELTDIVSQLEKNRRSEK